MVRVRVANDINRFLCMIFRIFTVAIRISLTKPSTSQEIQTISNE